MEFNLCINVDKHNLAHYTLIGKSDANEIAKGYIYENHDTDSYVLGEDILPLIYRDIKKDFNFLKEEFQERHIVVDEMLPRTNVSHSFRAFSLGTATVNDELGSPLYLLLYRDIINSPNIPMMNFLEKKESEYEEAKCRIRFLAENLYDWQMNSGTSMPDFGGLKYGKIVTIAKKLLIGVSTQDYIYPNTVVDVVNYLFLEMLKHNVRLIKCKNCLKLFPEYTKRHIEYCDYLALPYKNATCRTGAIVHLSETEHSYNEIMALFNKHYKTQHARMRAKNVRITKQELDEWTARARKARELTADGRYSLEEFEKFLKGEESEIKIP